MTSASFDLRGLSVLVTASTRGIGFYVARGLASMGARVVVSGRSWESVGKALEELRGLGEVYGVAADLRRREDLERLLGEAWRLLGGLDAIVFNAGNVACEPCFLHEAGYGDWLEAAQLHLIAPGYLSSLYIKRLLEEERRGVLVFLSSVSVREPMPHFVLADTARAGLVQLAKSIALRYGGRGIRAYTVLMGSFDTPGARRNIAALAERMGISFEEAWRRWVLGLTPLGRVGRPEEIASLVAFLLTPEAEYMNGSTLTIDGAMTKCAV